MKKLICLMLVLVLGLSLMACGGKSEGDNNGNGGNGGANVPTNLNLAEIYTTITNGVNIPEMMKLDADLLLDLYGIRAEYYTQAEMYLCVNSLRADEIWLLEAKDSASMETLKQLMQARLDQKDAESITYDPEQNAIVKAAQIIEAGNYLVMIVSPDAATIAGNFRTAAGI